MRVCAHVKGEGQECPCGSVRDPRTVSRRFCRSHEEVPQLKSAVRGVPCLPETGLPQRPCRARPWAGRCLRGAGPRCGPAGDGCAARHGVLGHHAPVAGSLRGAVSPSPQTFAIVGGNKVSSVLACLLQGRQLLCVWACDSLSHDDVPEAGFTLQALTPLCCSLSDHPGGGQWRGEDVSAGPVRPGKVHPRLLLGHRGHRIHSKHSQPQGT